MCGIAGFSISDKDHRKLESRRLAKMLLLQIIQRGRDATGAAWTETTKDGASVWYAKSAVPATDFVASLKEMPTYARSAILHTRYATQGTPENNDNNHPIVVPRIVGVHNGHIANDDEIIAKVGGDRTGQVDSEAIFRLIAAFDNPLPMLPKLDGRAAIAWYDTDDPTLLHLARLSGSPLSIGWTEHGSLVFASTEHHLRQACSIAGAKLVERFDVPEWTYYGIRKGTIVVQASIKAEATRVA